ncbi:MAG TPA: glycosyltransferase [Vitreimonas sp.]|nr:glycosyltransferase [Vitreimonas sp.]
MKTKPTIALLTAPQGHLSIGQAAQEILSNQYHIEHFHFEDPWFSIYKPIYQFLPIANQIPFALSKNALTLPTIKKLFLRRTQKRIERFLNKVKPDLCLSTYFMYNPALEAYQQRTGVPFINVLADPVSIHPMHIAPEARVNLVFDEHALRICQELEPGGHYEVGGWLVRQKFQRTQSTPYFRDQLGLDPDTFTLLIASGSEGSALILKILPLLVQTTQPLQVILVCGKNKMLYQSLKKTKHILAGFSSSIKLVVLPFVENMHEYMMAADIVVGKAGPNTIFEAAQTLTPFFAITHIAGQEDGNLELIKKYRLGLVEERLFKIHHKLERLITHPKVLAEYQAPLKKMAAFNDAARATLLKLVSEIIAKNS